jgi:hypothetical protein
MAISIIRSLSGSYTNDGPTQTLAFDCTGDGNGNYCLVVFVGNATNVDQILTGATYNGVSMTARYNDKLDAYGGNLACFRLLNPTSGTNNIVITWDVNSGCSMIALMLSGVDQTTPITAHEITVPGAPYDTQTATVASATGELVIDCASFRGGTDVTTTIGAGQTLILKEAGFGGTAVSTQLSCSYEAGAATNTMSWTYAPSATYNSIMGAFSFKNATGGGPSTVVLANPLATVGFRLQTTPDLAAGDIVEYEVYGGTGSLVVNTDASFVAASTVTHLRYRVDDGGGFGDWAIDEIAPRVTRPVTNTLIPQMTVSGSGTVV